MSRDRGQSDPGGIYCTSRGGSSCGGQLVCVSTEFQAVSDFFICHQMWEQILMSWKWCSFSIMPPCDLQPDNQVTNYAANAQKFQRNTYKKTHNKKNPQPLWFDMVALKGKTACLTHGFFWFCCIRLDKRSQVCSSKYTRVTWLTATTLVWLAYFFLNTKWWGPDNNPQNTHPSFTSLFLCCSNHRLNVDAVLFPVLLGLPLLPDEAWHQIWSTSDSLWVYDKYIVMIPTSACVSWVKWPNQSRRLAGSWKCTKQVLPGPRININTWLQTPGSTGCTAPWQGYVDSVDRAKMGFCNRERKTHKPPDNIYPHCKASRGHISERARTLLLILVEYENSTSTESRQNLLIIGGGGVFWATASTRAESHSYQPLSWWSTVQLCG